MYSNSFLNRCKGLLFFIVNVVRLGYKFKFLNNQMLIIKEKTVLILFCKQFSENAENLLKYFTFFIAGPKTIFRCNEM